MDDSNYQEPRLSFPADDFVTQYIWHNLGSYTAAILDTAGVFAVTDRTQASVDAASTASINVLKPLNGTVSIEFRFRTDSAGAGGVFTLWACAGVDYYQRVATLTCTKGTQADADGNLFADTIGITNNCWLSTIGTAENETTPENEVARIVINTHGYDRFAVSCASLASATTVYCDYRRA
jgi:hypothetical protein